MDAHVFELAISVIELDIEEQTAVISGLQAGRNGQGLRSYLFHMFVAWMVAILLDCPITRHSCACV